MGGAAVEQQGREIGGREVFTRPEWAALGADAPPGLASAVAGALRSAGEEASLAEVEEVLLPLSRLLHLHVTAARRLAEAQGTLLGRPATVAPYVLAVAGSVAVGKSTFARLLRAELAIWPDHPRVQVVATDGFLYPNRVLKERGLMERKGFPDSYDLPGLIAFLRAVKAGAAEVRAPVYSHMAYDVRPEEAELVRRPDILIVEGLNVLQVPLGARVAASEFFDFSIYLDAAEADIERWFIERVLRFRETAFRDPRSYFHHVSGLSPEEATRMARGVWRDINGPNLRENIAPTKDQARLILTKGPDHEVREVALRRA